MIEKEDSITPGAGLRLKKKGTFDLNKLYKEMRDWFSENDYDFQEKENAKKETDKGQQIIIKWEADRKIDEYAQFKIKVNFLMEEIEEVRKDNKKLNEGTVEIKFWADVILDYTNKWEKKPFGKFLFNMYNNYVIKSKIENVYEEKLDRELNELVEIAKNNL